MTSYTVTRPAYRVGTSDGGYTVPEESRTFTTAAALLRWAIKEDVFSRYGRSRKPERFSDPRLGSPGNRWGVKDSFCRWNITPELVEAMAGAQTRYNEIVHYLREVEPAWRPDVESTGNDEGIVHYADNSTEIHEINKYGVRRHRMAVAPHGDVCF